ncbi:MAG: hypothetical protein FJZ92_01775 [Chloroflexi bacterium]|nr:hypothetical protein [Chloroflexota bacterium]
MTTPVPHDPSRALAPLASALPARRAPTALAMLTRRALPVVARSVVAGVAVLAAERAVRELARGAVARVRSRPAVPRTQRFHASYTETTIVERIRVRRR